MMSEEVMEEFKSSDKQKINKLWQLNDHYSVNGYLNLYPSFFLLKNLFFVAHDRFVSIFLLNKGEWRHVEMPDEVKEITANKWTLP